MYMIDERTGRVIRISDGKIIAPTQSILDQDFISYNLWIDQGNAPIIINDGADSGIKKITKLAFTNRFTITEKIAIEIASIDNIAGTMQERQVAASLRVYLEDIDRASFIDLSDPGLPDALSYLVLLGILTQDRINEIINNPIKDIEAIQ